MCELASIFLPHDTIEKLICSECKEYLRSGPVKMKLDGDSICGNCASTTKFGTAIHNKALNEVLRLVKFPCKYESFGCPDHLQFDDNTDHEEVCVFKSFCCPADFLNCSWLGIKSHIPQHFRGNHKELCMNGPRIKIKINESLEETYLYTLENFAFLVKCKISLDDGKIWINLEHIGDKKVADLISYKPILHAEDEDDLKMILKERNPHTLSTETLFNLNDFYSVDIKSLLTLLENPIEIFCSLSIYVPAEVVRQTKEDLKQIKCPNCRIYMVVPIFKCPEGHYTCEDCTGYDNKCRICKKTDVKFYRDVQLETRAVASQLKCRWSNCKKIYNSSTVRKHEQSCQYRLYKCPRCYKWYGTRKTLVNHFQEEHDTHPLHTSEITIIEGDTEIYDFYALAFGEIFGCSLFKTNDNEKNISVWFYGTPSSYANYKYQVEIKSGNAELDTKLYELVKCSANEQCLSYNLKIPNYDLEPFGKDFEIIFKIVKL